MHVYPTLSCQYQKLTSRTSVGASQTQVWLAVDAHPRLHTTP